MPEVSEPREYTKEELAAIYAHYKSKFSVEDLLGYIEDNEPLVSADESLQHLEAAILKATNQTSFGDD